MHRSAKPSRQCAEALKRANSTLGIHDKKGNSHQGQGYNTKVVQITGQATVGILHPGMESIPETGHVKTGEGAKKSHKNDPWL